MPVQRVCRPNHEFRGFQGQIEEGSVSVGDEIITLPTKEHVHVKSIHVGDKEAQSASIGQPVTIQLDREVDVSRGSVLAAGADLKLATEITATNPHGWMMMFLLITELLCKAWNKTYSGRCY